jgi:hypothetical protein
MAELSAHDSERMSASSSVQDRVKIAASSVRAASTCRRSRAVDVTSLSTALSNVPAARVQLDVATAVLDTALDSSKHASLALVDALSVSEPAGLTFSPAGLSPGKSSRFVADL